MKIKRFRGASLADVLRQIKEEMGADAIILETRRRGFLGLMGGVEVIAARDANLRVPRDQQRPAQPVKRPAPPAQVEIPNPVRDWKPEPVGGSPAAPAEAAPPPMRITPPVTPGRAFKAYGEGRGAADEPGQAPAASSAASGSAPSAPKLGQAAAPTTPTPIAGAPARPRMGRLLPLLAAADLGAEVSEQLAQTLPVGLERAPEGLTAAIKQSFESGRCRFDPIQPDGRGKAVALVGPTGAGKTTTIAKLAAHFSLIAERRVGLITVDTYRVGAVEQLQTYAEILNIPLIVVNAVDDMLAARQELSRCDLVLIDTAGRNHHDGVGLGRLRRVLAAGEPDQVHLVISASQRRADTVRIAPHYRDLGVSHLTVTKLDETPARGLLLEAPMRLDLPLAYLAFGQTVPDDLEPASAEACARWMAAGLSELELEEEAL
ncbi:MAG: flagellar biosynthesis protein FlhF [Thermaerobacterales bacterium]